MKHWWITYTIFDDDCDVTPCNACLACNDEEFPLSETIEELKNLIEEEGEAFLALSSWNEISASQYEKLDSDYRITLGESERKRRDAEATVIACEEKPGVLKRICRFLRENY